MAKRKNNFQNNVKVKREIYRKKKTTGKYGYKYKKKK